MRGTEIKTGGAWKTVGMTTCTKGASP